MNPTLLRHVYFLLPHDLSCMACSAMERKWNFDVHTIVHFFKWIAIQPFSLLLKSFQTSPASVRNVWQRKFPKVKKHNIFKLFSMLQNVFPNCTFAESVWKWWRQHSCALTRFVHVTFLDSSKFKWLDCVRLELHMKLFRKKNPFRI
jgi:hypothetical protein